MAAGIFILTLVLATAIGIFLYTASKGSDISAVLATIRDIILFRRR